LNQTSKCVKLLRLNYSRNYLTENAKYYFKATCELQILLRNIPPCNPSIWHKPLINDIPQVRASKLGFISVRCRGN